MTQLTNRSSTKKIAHQVKQPSVNIRLYPEGLSSPFFPGTFWIHGRTNIAGISRFEQVAWCPGLYWFHTCALCHEVSYRELFANILSLPFVLSIVSFQSSLKTHDQRWGSEQRPIKKLTALWSLKAPVSSPRSNKAQAEMGLLYQSVHQSLCCEFRHLWIPPQGTWMSPPVAVYFCSLAEYTA